MRTFLLLSAAVLLSVPAQADPVRDALAQITKCADIASSAERLQCFDTATTGAKSALAAPAIEQTAAAQTDQKPAEESGGGVLSWFGLSRPVTKPEQFGKPPPAPDAPKEIQEISANVLEFAKTAYGRSIFVLENGQVWKQVDGDQIDVKEPAKGETMKVTIETAFMGSYNLKVLGHTGTVKVRRIK